MRQRKKRAEAELIIVYNLIKEIPLHRNRFGRAVQGESLYTKITESLLDNGAEG